MEDQPIRVVVDCSGKVGMDVVERMYADALKAAKAGDMDAAAKLAQAADAAAADVMDGPVERVVPLTAEELAQRERDEAEAPHHAAVMMRLERNARLAASDWAMLADSPLLGEERAAWAEYRQALRDMPASSDPMNPTWPEAPK